MADPFDENPELAEVFKQFGVVRKPGMADELLREVAPLLAAEGIDLNSGEHDIDTLNAALGRAVERRNVELFTPVGETRAMASTVLRLIAEAITSGDTGLAHGIILDIEPEPGINKPSVAHIIGVSCGTLDTWHTDPALTSALAGTRIPAWDAKKPRAAGTDILALARKGRAFDAIGGLHRKFDGLTIMEGGILAVTGSLASRAGAENTTVRDVALTALV
jgi:hypothetical protein